MTEVLVLILISLLTIGGFFFRVQRLAGVEGTLHEDEARLALAAEGILATGLPTVPSGRVYLRGALSSYLTAGSLWLFGRSDFAARLPNAVVGALLAPLLFIFGRALGGTAAGLCLAFFAAVQPELIRWSANAWMTSLFVVVFVGAAYLLYLGYERDEARMQLLGAAAAVVAILAHELGTLLAIAVAVTLAIRAVRGDFVWFDGRRSAAALTILGFGVLLFVALGLFLRIGTVSGATGEFEHYFGPSFVLDRFLIDYQRWWPRYGLLLAAAVAGIALLSRALKSGGLFLYVTMAVSGATVWFIIAKQSERYGVMLLPLLALVAAWGLAEGARLAGDRLRLGVRAAGVLRAVLFILAFGASLQGDLFKAVRQPAPPTHTWLTAFQGLGAAPGDLVFSHNPEIPYWYLGRADYWERAWNYERYSYVAGDRVRHVYTGAVKVGSDEEFLRLVENNSAKTLWYVGVWPGLKDLSPDIQEKVFRLAQVVRPTRDGMVILRIDLGAPELAASERSRRRVSTP